MLIAKITTRPLPVWVASDIAGLPSMSESITGMFVTRTIPEGYRRVAVIELYATVGDIEKYERGAMMSLDVDDD